MISGTRCRKRDNFGIARGGMRGQLYLIIDDSDGYNDQKRMGDAIPAILPSLPTMALKAAS
jgi:hypothetical protein